MKIELQHISKSFKQNKVLNDINITLESGKIYGLIGHNGSGKTVLMKIISGILKPTSGLVLVDDIKLGDEIEVLPDVGVIFEKPEFFGDLTGFKNLELLAKIKNQISQENIVDTMKELGLDPNNKLKVKAYSLGMVQRLGICQAIMENQKVLLLDEPTNALDLDGVKLVLELLLKKKQEGCLIMVSSHQLEELYSICDEIYRINHMTLESVNRG